MDEKEMTAVINETAAEVNESTQTEEGAKEVVTVDAAGYALLKAENERMKALLEKAERLRNEGDELKLLFPEADVETLPDEVNADWEKGIPLAAAYSLWDKRRQVAKANADAANRLNAEGSPGPIENDGAANGHFTLDDIRRMPREEVRNYLDRIYKSLESRR